MADQKISDLADGAPAVGTDQFPIARAGSTLRLTLANLQGLASVTSNEVSVVAAAAADALSVANVASNAASVVSVAVNVVSNALSNEISARTSAVNVVSNALSNELSVRTAADLVLAAAVDVVSNTVSNEISARTSAVNTVSNALSNEISNRLSADGVLAAAINVVSNALSNEISGRTSAVNAVSNILSALIVDHNTLSNRVSANSGTGGAGSVTSAEVEAVSAQAASAIAVVSNAVSVLTSAMNRIKILQGDFTVSSSGLVDVSGLGLTLETVGGIYEMTGALFVRYTSTAAAAAGYGLTFPGMKMAGGQIEHLVSIAGSNLMLASGQATRAWFNEEASGSIVLSVVPGISASATRQLPVMFRGTFVVSTAGVLQLQARSSSALTTSAPVVAANSYLRVIKVG